jgi:MarR family transcriptional regulator for hemolysin
MEYTGVGLELRSLNNIIRRYFDFSYYRSQIDAITGNNGWIIAFLGANEDRDIFQRDLEEKFTITRSTASRVLTLMEQKGLIQRQSVERDARLKKIVLTDKARQVQGMMLEDARRMEETLLTGFTSGEIETLIGYIRRMKDNISQISQG